MRQFNLLICFILSTTFLLSQNVGFAWAKQMPGLIATRGLGTDLKLDAAGNIFCAGSFEYQFDFDPSPAVFTLSTNGSAPFIAKYDNAGTLVWAKHFQNPSNSTIYQGVITSICLDNGGNVYSTGAFSIPLDFDPGPATFTMDPALGNGFLTKLDMSGNLVWAKQFGRDSSGKGTRIHLNSAGSLILVGEFKNNNNDLDPGPAVYNVSALGSSDFFISEITTNGNLNWTKVIGGAAASTFVSSSVIDNSGNIVTIGTFSLGIDFDPGTSTFTMNSQNGKVFVNVLSSNGTFVNAWQLNLAGGAVNDVNVDNFGNIHLTGQFSNPSDFDPGPGTSTLSMSGPYDAFVSKYSAAGTLIWAKALNGPIAEIGYRLRVNSSAEVFVSGSFQGTLDLNPGSGSYNIVSPVAPPYVDSYMVKLDPNGIFLWGKQFTGPGGETINQLVLDQSGNVFATGGVTNGSDLDPGPGTFTISALAQNPYILKLAPCQAPTSPSINVSPVSACGPAGFTLSCSPTTSVTWRSQLMSNTYISTTAVLATSVLPIGTYTFYAAASNSCAESFPPSQVQVSVFPIPNITLVSSKDTFCLGEPVTLTGSGGVNYAMGNTFFTNTLVVWPLPGATFTINGGDSNGCTSTASVALKFDLCTAIANSELTIRPLVVWPNPATTKFNVTYSNLFAIKLYNSALQMIYCQDNIHDASALVDLSLTPGIYYLQVQGEDQVVAVRKVVISE